MPHRCADQSRDHLAPALGPSSLQDLRGKQEADRNRDERYPRETRSPGAFRRPASQLSDAVNQAVEQNDGDSSRRADHSREDQQQPALVEFPLNHPFRQRSPGSTCPDRSQGRKAPVGLHSNTASRHKVVLFSGPIESEAYSRQNVVSIGFRSPPSNGKGIRRARKYGLSLVPRFLRPEWPGRRIEADM